MQVAVLKPHIPPFNHPKQLMKGINIEALHGVIIAASCHNGSISHTPTHLPSNPIQT
jgi:hypothetical protein